MSGSGMDDLLRAVEHHHTQYLKHLRLFHEATAKNIPGNLPGTRIGTSPLPSPALRAVTFPAESSQAGVKRGRRFTNDGLPDSGSGQLTPSPLDSKPVRPASVYEAVNESVDDLDEFLPLTAVPRPPTEAARSNTGTVTETFQSYVSKPLRKETFTDGDLVNHLVALREKLPPAMIKLSERLPSEIAAESIPDLLNPVEEAYAHATYDVYEVDKNGRPGPPEQAAGNAVVEAEVDGDPESPAVAWSRLSEVNARGEAVGRMTILQEPSPLMLGAAHMTLQNHFDMDELLQHLVTTEANKGKTRAYMSRAYEPNPLRQRTFFFVFKYYTIVEEGLTPAPWQAFDARPPDKRSPDHIDIAECSSVLALSLDGDHPARTVKSKVRRRNREGKIYDTFAPWHLLNVQCFPDDEHSMRSEDFVGKPFYNGPYAFLSCLAIEYRDAVKRYTNLNQSISKLITPPNAFMFDAKLRDKLLFEDKDFTYSRRYFWAYNTLGVINDGIKSMRSAYLDTFTKEFWAGRHPTLWPHPLFSSLGETISPDVREYLSKLEGLRVELEAAVKDLQDVYDRNNKTRDEIRSLREQLFSGSSVKESRRAIEQGDNIKILTSVSMIFLPLTFVTSVFGITNFELSQNDWQFPVTMVSVCIPFFLLIVILQTQAAMQAVKRSLSKMRESAGAAWLRVVGSGSNASPGVVSGNIVGAGGGNGGVGSSVPGGVSEVGRRARFRKRRSQMRRPVGTGVNVSPRGGGTGGGGGGDVVMMRRTQSQVQVTVQHGQKKKPFWSRLRGRGVGFWGWDRTRKKEVLDLGRVKEDEIV